MLCYTMCYPLYNLSLVRRLHIIHIMVHLRQLTACMDVMAYSLSCQCLDYISRCGQFLSSSKYIGCFAYSAINLLKLR
jgi:hypothetical protein